MESTALQPTESKIPKYNELMLPFLQFLSDGQNHSLQDTIKELAISFLISESDLKKMLPSGQQTVFAGRVGWARTYLIKAGLIERPERAIFRITERGKNFLAKNPQSIGLSDLQQFDGFSDFIKRKSPESGKNSEESFTQPMQNETLTPEEALEYGYLSIRNALQSEIIDKIKSCSPKFFERLVVELLLKMGYGGSRQDAGEAIGSSGDGGIDGIIKEDRLGLDSVYIQAKRWDGIVGRPEIQKFAGALQGRRARKGVFITTSRYSSEANDYVSQIECKIVLIDGERLAKLMIDFNVGITPDRTYEIKRLDSDYFLEDEA